MSCSADSRPRAGTANLYEQLGGRAGVRRLVRALYFHTFSDPRLAPFFQAIDSRRLLRHQESLFEAALGGPRRYQGRSMAQAHAHLVRDAGLDKTHVEAICENLAQTLADLGVSPAQTREIVQGIRGLGQTIFHDKR